EGASGRLSAANAMADVFEAPSPTQSTKLSPRILRRTRRWKRQPKICAERVKHDAGKYDGADEDLQCQFERTKAKKTLLPLKLSNCLSKLVVGERRAIRVPSHSGSSLT